MAEVQVLGRVLAGRTWVRQELRVAREVESWLGRSWRFRRFSFEAWGH